MPQTPHSQSHPKLHLLQASHTRVLLNGYKTPEDASLPSMSISGFSVLHIHVFNSPLGILPRFIHRASSDDLTMVLTQWNVSGELCILALLRARSNMTNSSLHAQSVPLTSYRVCPGLSGYFCVLIPLIYIVAV
jgi:hypothetical protein